MNESAGHEGSRSGLAAAGSWILTNFLRLLTAVVLGAAIGAGLFYAGQSLLGLPASATPEPVPTASDELEPLRMRIEALEGEQAALLQRVGSLERENAAQQDALLVLLDLEAQLAESSPTPAAADADEDGESTASDIDALSQRLDAVEQTLSTRLTRPAGEEEWHILRSMVFVLRAKISLMEDDLGQAQRDLELAQATLEELADLPTVDIILNRIGRVLDELSSTPQVAQDDVTIIWNLLVDLSNEGTSDGTDS